MTDYDCYSYAKELGFTEQEARDLAASKVGKGQDATVLRRLATAKGLPSMKPKYPVPSPPGKLALEKPAKPPSKPPVKRKRIAKPKPTKP